MVTRRDIGILAVLAIGAFFLSRRATGSTDFEGVPADPANFQREKQLQAQFDELGDVLTQQDVTLLTQQDFISSLRKQISALLAGQGSTSGTRPRQTLGASLGAPVLAGINQFVTNFGKIPSNLRGGPRGR